MDTGGCATAVLAGGNLEYIGRGWPGEREAELKLLSEGETGIVGVAVSTKRGDKGTAVTGVVAIFCGANGRSCAGVSDILCLFLKRAMNPFRPGPEFTGL